MTGRYCGALGCRETAAVVIDHPRHSERTVCEEHAAGFEVLRTVG